MHKYYGCDAHKKYSVFRYVNEAGDMGPALKVLHERSEYRDYLETLTPGSSIAIESIGNWYWMIDEIEKAGHEPILTHAGKAKLMMGQINKTDKLDAGGLAILLRNGTIPSVWIPPGELRDQRELPRMRMAFVSVRTKMKNRIHAALAKYAISIEEVKDIFGVKGRELLEERMQELPPQTRETVKAQLKLLDQVQEHLRDCEKQIEEVVEKTPEMGLLKTIPGVGSILAVVISMEVGDVERFPGPSNLASYAGTVPRVKSSGGRTTYGRVRSDINRYLKWAFVEAANVCVLNQHRWPDRHVVQLYKRIRHKRGHAKAVVAVARHLAEATYWMLKKGEPYRDPKKSKPVSSTQE